MQLTIHSDYALRILIFCGSRNPQLVTIPQVSEAYNISRHHVGKIVTELGDKGYLRIQRGRGGGFSSTEKALCTTVGDLVRAMEPNFNLVECFKGPGENHCPLTPICKLKSPLVEATEAFLAVLDQYTLREMITKNTRKFFEN
ncbi:MAG: Rrf2 family transcriptional regulator [Sumerlaeia bacterium]